MKDVTILLIALLLAAGGIVWAASRLAVCADHIAERFNLSRAWIGLLFVSIVTTLPEGSVTISALVKVGRPDMALSNNFGSIMFNLLIIAIVDAIFRRGGILRFTRKKHALPVVGLIVMLLMVVGVLLFPMPLILGPVHTGFGSVMTVIVFFGLFVFMQKYEACEVLTDGDKALAKHAPAPMRRPVAGFVTSGVVVVVCAVFLAYLGDRLADELALRHSFVGFVVLAIISSLPELTFGIAAARIGAYDLLLGNIMGANMINAMIIALADTVYWRETLSAPEVVGMDQVIAGVFALLASFVILRGVINRRKMTRRRFIGMDSCLLVLVYIACVLAMYFGV